MMNYFFKVSVFCALSAALFGSEEPKSYRQYDESTPECVKRTYYQNHTQQTLDFVLQKKKFYGQLGRCRMGLWDVVKLLDNFVDESDPDTGFAQSVHAFQTAEAIRKDGHPRWLVLVGFIHDLGKMLSYFNEPQWAVVGDTFPVGCPYDPSIVFHEYFKDNPDSRNPQYQSQYGIYKKGCGFNNLHMSYGHDEYLYEVMKPYLPKEALYVIRFHSFYPAHRENAYTDFMNNEDQELMQYVKLFCKYDLYSKTATLPDIKSLMPYYQELVKEFLPDQIDW
jgi:inositol oxygenase